MCPSRGLRGHGTRSKAARATPARRPACDFTALQGCFNRLTKAFTAPPALRGVGGLCRSPLLQLYRAVFNVNAPYNGLYRAPGSARSRRPLPFAPVRPARSDRLKARAPQLLMYGAIEAIEVLAVCADGRRRPGPTGSRPERLRFTAAAAGDVSASNSAERVSARVPSVCACVCVCARARACVHSA